MSELSKILHVEDDPEILEIASMSLDLIGGFVVEQADCGEKALEIIEAFAPQIILIDVQMPGMTGPETLAAIRELPGYETIPAIFMTAKLMDADSGNLLGQHDLGVIAKPFDPIALADAIRSYWSDLFDNAA